ncbi:MAG TPA: hypothetical protein VM890_16590, partial [Longimicrobium sp.]|nr:hypothetical protein [Longimicrobium sp.]
LPRPEGHASGWAGWGRLYAQLQPPTGTPIRAAATNNALVTARVLRSVPGPFDPEFGLTGGSDSLFFLRAAREGARLVSADDAVVEESVPPERLRARWLLRRAFRVGNGAVFCERALPAGSRRVGQRVAKATGRLMAGAVLLPPSLLLGRTAALRALWDVCYGAGCLAGVAGYRYAEYRNLGR